MIFWNSRVNEKKFKHLKALRIFPSNNLLGFSPLLQALGHPPH